MPTILVIDDDTTLTKALAIRLRSEGFDVLVSNDGASGALIAVHERVDLILLDVELSDFSGLELHECLKCSDRARNVPVVYLSAFDSHFTHIEAMRLGARAFITKPYDLVQLLCTIRETLSISASSKELANTGG